MSCINDDFYADVQCTYITLNCEVGPYHTYMYTYVRMEHLLANIIN